MRAIPFLLGLFLMSSLLHAQTTSLEWANPIGGSGYESQSRMAFDPTGNLVTIGIFSQTVDFDPNPTSTVNLTTASSSNQDMFIMKTDPLKNLVWVKQVKTTGSSAYVDCRRVILDNTGNIYITGLFSKTCDFNPDPVQDNNLTAVGGYNSFVLKLDGDGNFLWVKQVRPVGASGTVAAEDITIDGAGDIINVGSFIGQDINLDPGVTDDTLVVSTSGTTTTFIQKLSPSGDFLWARKISSQFTMAILQTAVSPYSVKTDENNNIYTSCNFYGIANVDPNNTGMLFTSNNGSDDILIHKLDMEGNFRWAKQIGGPLVDMIGGSVFDNNWNLNIVGDFTSDQLDVDPGAAVYPLTNEGSSKSKGLLVKLDTLGNFISGQGIGGTTAETEVHLYDVRKGFYGELLAAGTFKNVDPTNPNNFYGTQSYFVKFQGGNPVYSATLGGSPIATNAFSFGFSFLSNASGELYACGTFFGTLDFDPGSGTNSIASMNNDIYVVKLSQAYPCLTVINMLDNGDNVNPIPGSLRAVVKCANSLTTHANITFAIPGAGPYTITSDLTPYDITNPNGITIDGQTQFTSGAGTGDQSITLWSQLTQLFNVNAGASVFNKLKFLDADNAIIATSDSLTVSNCEFIASCLTVNLTASTDDNAVLVTNNKFSNFAYGFRAGYVNGLKVLNNTFTANNYKAISCYLSNRVLIEGNTVFSNSSSGTYSIYVENTDQLQIKSNDLSGAGSGAAILLSGATNSQVLTNTIQYCGRGVLAQDCEDILIKLNTFTNAVYAVDITSSAAGQGVRNKISQNDYLLSPQLDCIFTGNGAVLANNGIIKPEVFDYLPGAPGYVVANGSGASPGDTVELYRSTGTSYRGMQYLGFAVADANGKWKASIPLAPFLFNGGPFPDASAFLLANTTDANGNTSPFNYKYPFRLGLCSNSAADYLPPTASACSGQPVTLDGTANGVTAYSWFDNQTNQLVGIAASYMTSTPGKYRIEISDVSNCIASDTIEVIAKALPTAAEFLMASEAGIGDEVLIIDISLMDKNTLVWDFGSGQTTTPQTYGYNIIFSTLGYHEVKVTTTQDGCSTTNSHFINIGQESKAGQDGKVYPYIIKDAKAIPNPSNGIFNLSVSLTQSKNITYEVLNFMGMLISIPQTTSLSALEHYLPVDLSGYSAGTYIVRIICDNDTRVIRVSKE